MIEKIDSIKVPERPTWLNDYMDDEEEPNKKKTIDEDNNPYQRITDMLKQELEDKVNSEPIPTIKELIQEIK